MKVLVAGGGIVGCSIAYWLRKAGADVVLVERGEIGGEASGAAAGMLIPPATAMSPGPFRDICIAAHEMYPSFLPAIQKESGVDPECVASGILVVAEDEGMVAPLRTYARRQSEGGVNTHWLDAYEVRALEPRLSQHVIGAAFAPDAVHVNPGALTNAIARAFERAGGELRTGTMLTGFLRGESRTRPDGRPPGRAGGGSSVIGVSTNTGDVLADAVVLAAGPWTGALLPRLGRRLSTPPKRGQMIAYRSTAVRHVIWGNDGYLVPKPRGFLYAGATVEDVGFRKHNTRTAVAGLRRMASALVPALRQAEAATAWAGLRPGSADDMPVLGLVPGWRNVYVSTGHFRNGILLGPLSGRLMASLVLEGKEDALLRPFRAERFGAPGAAPPRLSPK